MEDVIQILLSMFIGVSLYLVVHHGKKAHEFRKRPEVMTKDERSILRMLETRDAVMWAAIMIATIAIKLVLYMAE